MIEVYKIISNIYDSNTSQTILNFREKNSINLRGHQFTLEHKRLYTPSRVNYFANRVVNNWNSLPDYVIGAGTLNMFKNSLDRLWSKQDLLYNYRATIEKSNYVSGLSIPSCHTDHRIRSLGGNCPTTTIAGNTSREFRLLTRSFYSIQPLNQTHQRIIFARIYLHHARHIRLV